MGAAATDVRSFSYWEQLQKTCADAASVSSCSYWEQLQQMCAAATSLHSCYICAQLRFCAQLQQMWAAATAGCQMLPVNTASTLSEQTHSSKQREREGERKHVLKFKVFRRTSLYSIVLFLSQHWLQQITENSVKAHGTLHKFPEVAF